LEEDLIQLIIDSIGANGINRNLSILGGETLDTNEKRDFIKSLLQTAKICYPNIKIVI
jgi:hypothetical protein